MKKQLLLLVLVMLPLVASADAVEINGIYYNLNTDDKVAEVTRNPDKYAGNIVIPGSFNYDNVAYSVTSIGDYAFYNCSSLASVTIPNSVTSIGIFAFSGCRLEKVIVKDLAAWCGIKFGSRSDNPLCHADHLYSDENTEITNLVIPDGVTSIGDNAFYECTGLTSVTIPSSVTSIGNEVFYYCTGLTSVTIGNSVTSIGQYAFAGCSGLTSVTIGNSVMSIGNAAFSGCVNLRSVTIPNSVTSIGINAFSGCIALTSVTIGTSVTSIGAHAFNGCTDLQKVIVPDIAAWCGIKFGSYDSYSDTNPLGIAKHLYSDENTEITNLVIPDGVTSISDYAFYNCSSFASVTIPNSVTSIGINAFSGCTGLQKVIVKDLAAWCGVEFGSFDANPLYYAKHLYSDENTEITNLVIPDGVTSISNTVFYNCSSLTSVIISNSVTSIGSAFANCTGLTAVTIGNSVTSISDYAFNGCTGLTTVTINNNSIVSAQRSDYYSLKDIFGSQVTKYIIGKEVKYIGPYAFYDCKNLISVEIPNGVFAILGCAFMNCENLASVEIPNSVTDIYSKAFYNCDHLTSVTIPSSVTNIGRQAFDGCIDLTSVTINSNSIVSMNRSNTHKLKDIFGNYVKYIIGEGVTSIGDYAFSESNMFSIEIPSSVTSIGENAFSGCRLEKVIVKDLAAWCGIKFGSYYGNPLYYAKHLYSGKFEINTLVIPDGVTSISDYAFYNCSSFASVTIPNSVMSIGNNAFSGCTGLYGVIVKDLAAWCGIKFGSSDANPLCYAKNLFLGNDYAIIKDLVIPDGVTSIGNDAFYNCTSLTSVTIPSSVTSIGDRAFYDCNSLTTVVVERRTPVEITSGVFTNRANATLHVPQGRWTAYKAAGYWKEFKVIKEPNFSFADANVKAICVAHWDEDNDGELNTHEAAVVTYLGTVFKGNTTIISFDELSYFIGLKSIDEFVFAGCSGLTSITLPNSVTSIGERAFYRCTGLTSIDIPNNVTSIGNRAFDECTGLTSVAIGSSVTRIGEDAFYRCTGLTSIDIPNNVTSIGNRAFDECTGLTSVTIGSGVTSIGQNAFAGCSGLTSIEIPNSVTSIGDYAFYECIGLTSVTIGSGVKSIGYRIFDKCNSLTSMAVESKNSKFDSRDNCNAIIETATNTLVIGCKNSVIPNSVTSIGQMAFRGCSNLTSVTIPNSVTSIGQMAFCECTGLTSVTIGSSVTSIGNSAFYGCSGLTSIKIPNSVKSIGNSAFSGCHGLTTVNIPNSVTSIGDNAFSGCKNLTSVVVESRNSTYDSRDNCNAIIETATNTLITGCKNTIIPNSVTSIGNSAFYGCSGLTSIKIPNSVKSIGNSAFSGCHGLTTVNIPNSVTSIGDNAFDDCGGLTSIDIPSSVTSIGERAFFSCSKLTSVIIPNSIKTIENYTFEYCSRLTSVIIPNSVTSIGDYAFSGCVNLRSVTIPNSVTSIGRYAFRACTGLTSVKVFAKTPPTAESYAFPSEQNITLYVPKGSKAAYEAADIWKDFSSIIEFDDIIKGDANDDKIVNVSDVVEIVNYIVNKPSDKFVFDAADINDDGEVNVTDIVKVVGLIISSGSNASRRASVAEMIDNDQLDMINKGNQTLSLNLQNEGGYVASQFDIVLSAGQTLESIKLNNQRMENHQVIYAKIAENCYKVVIYSLDNATYNGHSGELLNIKVAGSGDVSVEDILFITAGQMEKWFSPLRGGTTGISVTTKQTERMDIYSTDGRLIRKQAESTNGLKKGLYIINGKKQIVK